MLKCATGIKLICKMDNKCSFPTRVSVTADQNGSPRGLLSMPVAQYPIDEHLR